MIQHFGFIKQVKVPYMLRKSSFSRLWYKPDTMFFTPKAYIRIDFNCPHSNYSPEATVLTDVFTRLLMDYLNEYGKSYHTFDSLDNIYTVYVFLTICLLFGSFTLMSIYFLPEVPLSTINNYWSYDFHEACPKVLRLFSSNLVR